jgi:acyl-coenzyme A synthetase/AMP-(fatty) acid ligase
MPQSEPSSLGNASLWGGASAAGKRSERVLSGATYCVAFSDLARGSCLGGRTEELRGRSVLIATADQLGAALALLELDGIARRLVLWPADLPIEHMRFVIASANVDAIVSDGMDLGPDHSEVGLHVACTPNIVPVSCDRTASHATEWVLLTSGTTGQPKMVLHTLASLCGAIEQNSVLNGSHVWSTFYDIRRYGGLQIYLRAMLTGGSLVLSSARESTVEFLLRAGARGVSHISGTPSHWRCALMSGAADKIAPRYVRLSGEIADQSILDNLRSFYSQAQVAHAFASTEAGVAFDVRDGLEGFPATLIGPNDSGVEMKVEEGSLRIRSSRTAARYIAGQRTLADQDSFVDTGDMLELRGGRYYFVGRRDGTINVGGQKVHPEEVEGVINRHPRVRMSLVRPRKNSLLGSLVIADVVLADVVPEDGSAAGGIENEILKICRQALPRHKVPSAIRFVNQLGVAANGKMVRQHA